MRDLIARVGLRRFNSVWKRRRTEVRCQHYQGERGNVSEPTPPYDGQPDSPPGSSGAGPVPYPAFPSRTTTATEASATGAPAAPAEAEAAEADAAGAAAEAPSSDRIAGDTQAPAAAAAAGAPDLASATEPDAAAVPAPACEDAPASPSPAAESATVALDYLADLDQRLAAIGEQLVTLGRHNSELVRLRARDADLIDRLHQENSALRTGEIAAALLPLVNGLLRLHDQMTSLAGNDTQSDAALLRTQLLQLLDTVTGISTYTPAPGEQFDAKLHSGTGTIETDSPEANQTIAATVRPGFRRADGTVVRVAAVEVYRHRPAPRPPSPTSAATGDPAGSAPAAPAGGSTAQQASTDPTTTTSSIDTAAGQSGAGQERP